MHRKKDVKRSCEVCPEEHIDEVEVSVPAMRPPTIVNPDGMAFKSKPLPLQEEIATSHGGRQSHQDVESVGDAVSFRAASTQTYNDAITDVDSGCTDLAVFYKELLREAESAQREPLVDARAVDNPTAKFGSIPMRSTVWTTPPVVTGSRKDEELARELELACGALGRELLLMNDHLRWATSVVLANEW